MKFLKLAPIAIALVLFASCSKQLDVPAQPPVDQATVSALPTASLATPQAAAATTTPAAPMVQKAVYKTITANVGGFLEALPGNYASSTESYPLIIFLHGAGEMGNGTTDLAKVANNGIPNLIKNNKFPASFTVKGTNYSFIVLSPQFKNIPATLDVNTLIDYAIKTYRVDASRIYVSGLSMGGGITWYYGGNYFGRVAAIVPMCGAVTPNDRQAKNIATSGMAVWAFHNNADPTVTVNNTYTALSSINAYSPVIAPRKTIFTAAMHNCWTKASDPNYKETINGTSMNIYEWMLQYKR